jgi:hypothetical protein
MKINNISFILICIITLFFIFIIYNGLEKYDGFSVNDVFTNNNKIPNIIHFCFLTENLEKAEEFYFFYYLAILSAKLLNNPDKIYFYYNYEPYGKWWDSAKKLVTLEKVDVPEYWGKHQLIKMAHKADKIRMDKLYERGGIYLDMDTISVRSYAHLLNNECVLGLEKDKNGKIIGICNAVMLTSPKSKFFKLWLLEYENHFVPNGWAEASIILPYKIYENNKDTLTLLNNTSFFYPSWEEIDKIFKESAEINSDLIVLHLWQSKSVQYLKNMNIQWVYNNKHTLYSKIIIKLITENKLLDYIR